MCSSKSKPRSNMTQETIARINGRPVLQPKSNQVPLSALDRRNSLKNPSPKSPNPKVNTKPSRPVSLNPPPVSPKSKSPRKHVVERGKDEVSCKVEVTRMSNPKPHVDKTSKIPNGGCSMPLLTVHKPGSIAAARREEVAMKQEERKKRIAHYGRAKSTKPDVKNNEVVSNQDTVVAEEKKRCSFITPTSDPIYVAYHDEEWGVPVHDDKVLFELLVLTSAQVGSDWTSVLNRRNSIREAFSGFDAEEVAEFSEKEIQTISTEYDIDLSQVLAAVDNSKQILKVKREFGSLNEYLWGFVKHRPIITEYRSCKKIPTKTSKSESISKDMVRRGFRFVGPTMIQSFMQATGITNDHLITCPSHLYCTSL